LENSMFNCLRISLISTAKVLSSVVKCLFYFVNATLSISVTIDELNSFEAANTDERRTINNLVEGCRVDKLAIRAIKVNLGIFYIHLHVPTVSFSQSLVILLAKNDLSLHQTK